MENGEGRRDSSISMTSEEIAIRDLKETVENGFLRLSGEVAGVKTEVEVLKRSGFTNEAQSRELARQEILYYERTQRDARQDVTQVKNLVRKTPSEIPVKKYREMSKNQTDGISSDTRDMIIKIVLGIVALALAAVGGGVAF